VGEVQAWNVDTGEKVWTHKYEKSPNWGAMLVTAGGVVFNFLAGTVRHEAAHLAFARTHTAEESAGHSGPSEDFALAFEKGA
jgi:hypothetical protein